MIDLRRNVLAAAAEVATIGGAMSHLKQFIQQTFAEETERITGGAIVWRASPEIRVEDVLSDGFLEIRWPHELAHLAAPWPEAQPHEEVMLELHLAGNPPDRKAVLRALLRRQARQVQRLEEQDAAWLGEEPLWLVAAHLPAWLLDLRKPVCFAPGCYWIEPQGGRFLWIAANELPLCDELIPFLMARSGDAFDEFERWVAPRQPPAWVLTMLADLSLRRQELLQKLGKVDDPESGGRRQHILLVASPRT